MSTHTAAPAATVTGPRGNTVINGIRRDTTTAERVLDETAGVFGLLGGTRFDEVIYRNDQGFWFVVRPLDPDEARERIERVDEAEARRRFPDGPADYAGGRGATGGAPS
jgi:hypothetical protein